MYKVNAMKGKMFMKTAADIIIELIEKFDVHDAGSRRAHGKGEHHKARVELNEAGKDIFGEVENAVVRLSNAATNDKVPDWLVNIKGCSVRFNHPLRPIDIIGINFPYFPFDSAAETLDVLYRIHFYLEDKSAGRFMDIFRAGGLYRDLGKILKWMPKSTDMDHLYYTAHSYGGEHYKMKLDYHPGNDRIEIYAEKDEHLIDYHPGPAVHLGSILINPHSTGKEVKYFDVLNAPPGMPPNGNLPLLRHYVYKRSFLRRMEEKLLDGKDLRMLEEVWAEEKYFVLSKSQRIYDEIRELVKKGTDMSATRFRELLDEAYALKYEEKHLRNYLQHVWGHFKDEADESEKAHYTRLSEHPDPEAVNTFIHDLAIKYKEPYILRTTMVKTRGRS
ncbi:DUF1722 domain-containing protein [Salinicoccus kekensis]|nr:DUF1722 domain-containing protein [Salinicoccus kekensis]